MRRMLSPFAAFTLVVAVPGLVATALAHGGGYRGPPGEIPPDRRMRTCRISAAAGR